jgi:predicted Rdx family selenoprotein
VRAASLAAELNRAGYAAAPVPGEKSQFDVVVDGETIFSKQREGRYPEPDEVLAALPPPS